MMFTDELKTRIAKYEAEKQRLESLIAHAKALLQEEIRDTTGQFPLLNVVATPASNGLHTRSGSVAEAVGEVLPEVGFARFAQVVSDVQTRLPGRTDRVELGKLVSAALNRGVKKGNLVRVARGVYRKQLKQPI